MPEMTTMKPKRTDDLTEQEKENLSSYVSDVDADVFVISNLNPEVVGAAIKIAKKAKDKTIFKLIYWLYLKEPSNAASFYDYVTFINLNPHYPRISRLKYLAEHKINLNTVPHDFVIKWFNGKAPLSSFGKIKLGEIYIKQKKLEKGL